MFWNVFAAEELKAFKRKVVWVESAIMIGLTLMLLIVMYAFADEPGMLEQALWPHSFINILQQFAANSVLGGMMLVILIGAIFAQEYAWRTMHMMLGSGVSRQTLLGAKFAATLLPLMLFVVTPVVFGGALSAFLTVQARGALDPSAVNFGQLALSVLYGAYSLLPYVALAFVLAVFSRSAVTTIGGGVGILFGESILWQLLAGLGGPAAQAAQWMPSGLSKSLLGTSIQIANGVTAPPLESLPALLSPGLAAVGIAVYTIALLGIAASAFARQDLTA